MEYQCNMGHGAVVQPGASPQQARKRGGEALGDSWSGVRLRFGPPEGEKLPREDELRVIEVTIGVQNELQAMFHTENAEKVRYQSAMREAFRCVESLVSRYAVRGVEPLMEYAQDMDEQTWYECAGC